MPLVAEWPSGLGKGLQSPVHGFDSRLRLHDFPDTEVPPDLRRAAVTAGTGPASASYDVDAATMHMERHERGIDAL